MKRVDILLEQQTDRRHVVILNLGGGDLRTWGVYQNGQRAGADARRLQALLRKLGHRAEVHFNRLGGRP